MRGLDKNMEKMEWSNLKLKEDEAAARGTQIKSMLGIKDNTPVTAEQLRYMKDNFVRFTGDLYGFVVSKGDAKNRWTEMSWGKAYM